MRSSAKCAPTPVAVDARAAAREWLLAGLAHGWPTRELHERLHTHRTFDDEQVRLNEKAPISGASAEPSSGLEPATPSLPWNHREPLCRCSFSQVTPDRRGQSYRFSFGEGMRSLTVQGRRRTPQRCAALNWVKHRSAASRIWA